MFQQLTATARNASVADFGSHTMLVDYTNRTVDIGSDSRASNRAARADWKAVCAELRNLGCTDLDELGYLPAGGYVIDTFAGTF